ncbi:membrane hypothetical protein [Candidatus Sulfopaludibacter sp. SbA3]|nr:membrane hypothetical protein [Candidatus Sulfopaludibacter sp. SbA3]
MSAADLTPLANHLWQSTICAGVAWLLILALRKNPAAARYWIWLAASIKFLVPFPLLISAGSQLGWRTPHTIVPARIPMAISEISQPFAAPAAATMAPAVMATHSNPLTAMLFAIWLCGAAMGIASWVRHARRLRSAVRAATPLDLNLPLPAMSSRERLEPGVIGVFRPVLLLPKGIADRLTPAELESVLAHELCHVARRDNLTAAIHMVVETVFWFHPAAWWIRTRLIHERERACDEEVIRLGREPHVYAESILKICAFCLASPMPCAAGVGGGRLKERIETIIENRFVAGLGLGKRIMLAVAATLAIVVPTVAGLAKAQGLQTNPRFNFEVASVKAAPERDYGTWARPNGMAPEIKGDPSRIDFSDVSLVGVICRAYGALPLGIKAPGWMQEQRYDIHANVPADAPKGHIPEMLQNLLADRFHVKLHWETREESGCTLTVSSGGLKLKQSAPDTARRVSFRSNGHFELRRFTMTELANSLRGQMGQPVIDKTELPGAYDIVFDAAPDSMPAFFNGFGNGQQASEFPTIFEALRRLGLELTRERKVPVKYLVVDSALKVPIEN